MPGALVNNSGSAFTSGPSASPITLAALGWTPAVGNWLYAGIRLSGNASATQPSVSDNINGGYTALGTWSLDGGAATSHGEVFKVQVATATAPALSFSWTGGNAGYTVIVWEVSATSGEVVAVATGTGALPTGGSVSPSGAGILFLFTTLVTNAPTFSGALDNAAGNTMTIDAPAGSFRASLSHRAGEAAGTYVPRLSQSLSEGWVAISVFALDVATGVAVVGRVGLRGVNDVSVTHTESAIGRVGLRGQNEVASKTSSAIGRLGLRGTSSANATHTETALGRLGLRGVNVVAAKTSATEGRVGLRGTNDSTKVVSDFTVGGVGARGTNEVVSKASAVVGRIGVRGTNTVNVTHTETAVGRTGLRGTNVSTRTSTTTATGRVGLRGACVAIKTVLASGAGRVGVRGVNIWVTGIPPTPEPEPEVNASDCEADWSLSNTVIWPPGVAEGEESSAGLKGCAAPTGTLMPWEI